jgi:aminoglycoside phosphotransferase (APT) family kinase protein
MPVAIDWPGVAAHLARYGMTLDLGFAPRRFAGGLANINMLVRVDGDWAVFRRPPAGPLPRGSHDMAREHRVLSRLWRHLPFAPRSLHFAADCPAAGAPFQILAYVPGRVVRGDSLAPLPDTVEIGRTLSEMLIETLIRIHAVGTAAAGLHDLGWPAGFLARTAAGWIGRARAVLGETVSPSCAFVIDWLERMPVPETAEPTLLHSDFKLDNIILAEDAIAPAAVVDWDMATRGDPLFDLATLLSYWTEPGDPPCMHRLAQMPTARPGFHTRVQVARAYGERTRRSLDGFQYHRVLAMLKLGVVFHQLHRRYANEGATDPRVAGFAALADGLLDFTAEIARGRCF